MERQNTIMRYDLSDIFQLVKSGELRSGRYRNELPTPFEQPDKFPNTN